MQSGWRIPFALTATRILLAPVIIVLAIYFPTRIGLASAWARLLAQFGRPYPRDLGYEEREQLYEEARKLEASQ
jgi:hypothetical protein